MLLNEISLRPFHINWFAKWESDFESNSKNIDSLCSKTKFYINFLNAHS
jgi:hypothetical protein